jgi:hypothetical protein
MWPFSRIHALLGIRTPMHFIFEPHFFAKLASLVPKPRVNLTRLHGVFVGLPHHPNSKYRLTVTPAKRGKGKQRGDLKEDKALDERRKAMTWAHRLKRVFTNSRRFRRY